MPEPILIVESELRTAEATCLALRGEGFECVIALDGETALAQYRHAHPQSVILDLTLPGSDAWGLFHEFRKQRPAMPVIVMADQDDEADRVAALEAGADEYVAKPFSMRELLARLRSVLRRSGPEGGARPPGLSRQGVSLDVERHEVRVDDRSVHLSPREFDLLAYLMQDPGRVRSRADIMRTVWPQDEDQDERTVDVHIRWLRLKIEPDPSQPRRLLTVYGFGYKFADQP